MGIASGFIVRQFRSAFTTLALAALVLGLAGQARAENDQTVVLGAGIGVHTFAKEDDLRKGSALFGNTDEIKAAGMSQLYLEWYALGNLGFGLRSIGLNASRTYTFLSSEVKQEIDVGLGFITVNWVPIGGRSYTRLGLLAGAGAATYKATETATGSPASTGSATGSASLVGAYIDWGGEDFGARFGVHSIQTSLKELVFEGSTTRFKVDGSGTAAYFDLRWAW